MNTPAPHSSAGHSRLSRWILPFSSTCKRRREGRGCRSAVSKNKQKKDWSRFYLIVFQHSQLNLLPLVLVLLGGGVGLLLPFLGTTTQPQHQVERRLLQHKEEATVRRPAGACGLQQLQQSEDSSPSGCCSRTACVHPPAASQRRSASAGQEGYLQGVTASHQHSNQSKRSLHLTEPPPNRLLKAAPPHGHTWISRRWKDPRKKVSSITIHIFFN